MEFEIVKTDTPDRSLLLLADESEESVADYAGRGTTYAACRSGQILGQYVLLHTRPFTAEVVNIAVAPEYQRRGIATADVDYSLLDESQRLRGDAAKVIDLLEGGGSPEDDYVVRKICRVNEGCAAMNANIGAQAARWLDAGKLVGLVGGDHSTPYGLIRALGERHAEFGILHIDAHCDLRRAYEGFEYSHASIMYNVLRDVPQAERIVEVGVRDYCDAEAELARSSERIRMFDDTQLSAAAFEGETWGATCRRIVTELPERVYVSFDIDGLSVEYCPHTGTPVAGGLTFNQAVYLLHETVRSGRRIIGFDVVEVVPRPGSSIDASTRARILYKLCGLTLVSNC